MAIYNGTANQYTKGKLKRGQKVYSFDTDSFLVLLTTSTHVPDQQNDEFVSDIVANELSGNGYARQAVAVTWAQDGLLARLTVDDPTWTAAGGDIVWRNWHLYVDLGGDAVNPLLAYGLGDATPGDITIPDTTNYKLDFSAVNGLLSS